MTYAALVESGLARSSEGVAVWLTLQAHHPGVKPPSDVWIKDSPLNSSNLANLGKILKEAGEDVGMQTKGSWNPKLNFVWEFISGVYFDEEGEWAGLRKGEIAEWKELWKVVVDGKFVLRDESFLPQKYEYHDLSAYFQINHWGIVLVGPVIVSKWGFPIGTYQYHYYHIVY